MQASAQRVIPGIVAQHVDEAAGLWSTRRLLLSAPHVKLSQLARHDERLAAHLTGIAVAGDYGRQFAYAALETPAAGNVFVASVGAIESGAGTDLDRLFAVVESAPDASKGFTSAFGWVSPQSLKGIASALLQSAAPFHNYAGIAACALHRVDASVALDRALSSPEARLRARALRTTGELGRRDRLDGCSEQLTDDDPDCAFWAAWSAVLLGERQHATKAMTQLALSQAPHRTAALQLVLKSIPIADALELLRALAREPANQRLLIEGAGTAGDPHYIPWLMHQMSETKTSRIAGESFSLITGVDFVRAALERRAPDGVELGPTENPEEDEVAIDPDDNLPWPDADKIRDWWDANRQRFQTGVRYFMGEAVNIDNCRRVLREGYQRQRIAAALHLSLLMPGTSLFPTSAPAWRQKRLLAKMG